MPQCRIDEMMFNRAQTLKEALKGFGMDYDLYVCMAAVMFNKIPRDVTLDERSQAKTELHMYSYSN